MPQNRKEGDLVDSSGRSDKSVAQSKRRIEGLLEKRQFFTDVRIALTGVGTEKERYDERRAREGENLLEGGQESQPFRFELAVFEYGQHVLRLFEPFQTIQEEFQLLGINVLIHNSAPEKKKSNKMSQTQQEQRKERTDLGVRRFGRGYATRIVRDREEASERPSDC
jgi:hypothetical protein